MLRQILRRPISFVRAASSDVGKLNLEVKINQLNGTFELHDAEVDSTSGRRKKFEFPFVYLRDNCQVRFMLHFHLREMLI